MSGKSATIMGLGRHGGGVAVTRWLAEQGWRVTVTDLMNASVLADSLDQLRDVTIEHFTLGQHEAVDFSSADMLVVNPAVRLSHPFVELARCHGVHVTSEIELFLERCPATVVGITGTVGKSTTATMLYQMLLAAGRRAWLGGNIGISLLDKLRQIMAEDVVVLELSSFQLVHLSDQARMPRVAVVTNCTPNHLDWHGSWQAYYRAKERLTAKLPIGGIAILNSYDREVMSMDWPDQVHRPSLVELSNEDLSHVPHTHNRLNANLAATAAFALGVERSAISAALNHFHGLPHRFQFVAEVAGRRFIDDSKATSPAATIAALAAVEDSVWLLAGGVANGADFERLALSIGNQATGAVFYGAAREDLLQCLQSVKSKTTTTVVEHLEQAVLWAFERSRPGDTVLLSPACASFDQFIDFTDRGQKFVEIVRQIEREKGGQRSPQESL